MASKAESKQFELLVARIEEAAAPRGAVVTSPDHIRDATSGQMREVDATIRFKIGTVPVLILVECRKRGRAEDVRWIEELTTKRDFFAGRQGHRRVRHRVLQAGLSCRSTPADRASDSRRGITKANRKLVPSPRGRDQRFQSYRGRAVCGRIRSSE